jgi:hypothetical protein
MGMRIRPMVLIADDTLDQFLLTINAAMGTRRLPAAR